MKPKFMITDRGERKALWVNEQNIWDLSDKEITNDVKLAIIHAYFLGAEQMKKEIYSVRVEGNFNSHFEEDS